MHVAGRHQGHAGGFADRAQLVQPFVVVPGAEQFNGQPDVWAEKHSQNLETDFAPPQMLKYGLT